MCFVPDTCIARIVLCRARTVYAPQIVYLFSTTLYSSCAVQSFRARRGYVLIYTALAFERPCRCRVFVHGSRREYLSNIHDDSRWLASTPLGRISILSVRGTRVGSVCPSSYWNSFTHAYENVQSFILELTVLRLKDPHASVRWA